MNPNGFTSDYFPKNWEMNSIIGPMEQGGNPNTSPSVLRTLTLQNSFQLVRQIAAQNPSTPLDAYAVWLLSEGVLCEEKAIFEVKLRDLNRRLDSALVACGYVLSDITDLPETWKLKLLA